MIWVKCPTCRESAVGSNPIYPEVIPSFSLSSVPGIMSCSIPLQRSSSTKLVIIISFWRKYRKRYGIVKFNKQQKPVNPTKIATFKAMNFLSHFYFEKGNHDDNMVMGVVLPD